MGASKYVAFVKNDIFEIYHLNPFPSKRMDSLLTVRWAESLSHFFSNAAVL